MSAALPSQDHMIRMQWDLKGARTGNPIIKPAHGGSFESPLQPESNVPRVPSHGEEI